MGRDLPQEIIEEQQATDGQAAGFYLEKAVSQH